MKRPRKIAPRRGQIDEWSPTLMKARLYNRLLVDIIIGELAPGQRLDEKALVHLYGGGLSGMREALTRLALEGLVVRRARVGTMVAPLDPEEARDAFAARALIETECAALAARRASPAEVDAIQDCLAVGEAAILAGDARALAAMDEAFHLAVASASHNRSFAKQVVALHHSTARFWLISEGQPSLAESRKALGEHRAVADAIAAHDAERARHAMRVALGEFPESLA
jgi:DNA-binding GntR family transcriptional regulator